MPNRNNPHPHMQPAHEHMSKDDKLKKLYSLIDDICSYLYYGVHWHQRAANYSRSLAIRGFGRLHEHMAKCDLETLQCLEKLCYDHLRFIPIVDMQMVTKGEMFKMDSMSAFKAHIDEWIKCETTYAEIIHEAIHYARKIDIAIYQKLVKMANHVEKEIMRARMLQDRLNLGGWTGADIAFVSQNIHEHFEHGEVDHADPMDYNLG